MRDPGCLASKPALRSAYERRRCILFADGFYEWKNRRRVRFTVEGLYAATFLS